MRIQRIEDIKKYLIENKSVTIDELCVKYSVSKNTIRRDIDELVKIRFAKKVYGGISLLEYSNSPMLTSYDERISKNGIAKDKIARKAASLVKDNQMIFIDTGTTCHNIIKYIESDNVTVLTNSLQVCISAISCPNIKVISFPGVLQIETKSFVGDFTTEFLSNFNIDKAFMACTGFSVTNGITNASLNEYFIKKTVISNSSKSFILADNSKFGKLGHMPFAQINDIDAVISDKNLDKIYLELFHRNNITFYIA